MVCALAGRSGKAAGSQNFSSCLSWSNKREWISPKSLVCLCPSAHRAARQGHFAPELEAAWHHAALNAVLGPCREGVAPSDQVQMSWEKPGRESGVKPLILPAWCSPLLSSGPLNGCRPPEFLAGCHVPLSASPDLRQARPFLSEHCLSHLSRPRVSNPGFVYVA